MNFPENIYLLSLASAFVVAFLGLPAWRYWCRTAGWVDDPGHRKIHREPVVLAGGLAVMTAMLVPVLSGLVLLFLNLMDDGAVEALKYGYGRRSMQLGAIFTGSMAVLILGWWDDRRTLSPLPKFLGQLAVALLVAFSGIRITLFVDRLWFSYLLTILWILTLINAFNFMDNMNGLCAGIGLIASLAFAASAAGFGQYLVTSLALLMAGALLGFLPYNYPKASSFLGDSGSHLVGFFLAILAILTTFYSGEEPLRSPWAVLSPLLILAVPLVDLVWVVWIRYRLGQPFYVGDNNHLSHWLVRRGFSQAGAVLLLWLLSLGAAAFSFVF